MNNQKQHSRIIEMLKYLWINTDKEHFVTIVELQKHLQEYGFNPDRKTLTKDIEILSSVGFFDIKHDRSTQNRYYITRRFFSEPEIKMLCDAVRSSYFISEKSSQELISVFKLLVGPTSREKLNAPVFIDNTAKTKNTNVIKNASKIAKAISEKKKISFKYFDYTVDRKKEHKGNKKYLVSPYAMVIDDGKYYFAGFEDEEKIVKTFRIDKVDSLSITPFDSEPQPKSFNIKRFASQTKMYSGYESEVELLCHKDAMYGIIDKFGTKVKTEKIDDEYFKATVNADISPTFFGWAVGYGGKIQIIGPYNVVDDFNDIVRRCTDIQL